MAGRAGAPLPEGRLPTGPPPIAMGAGTDSPRHLTTHHVPSTDAPPFSRPRMSGAILARGSRGCNPRAEADFAIRSIVSSHQERAGSGKSKNPLPGGLPPPGPPADCDWSRDGQDTPARPSIVFSSTDALPSPSPHVQGNRVQGFGGCNPRRTPSRTWLIPDAMNDLSDWIRMGPTHVKGQRTDNVGGA